MNQIALDILVDECLQRDPRFLLDPHRGSELRAIWGEFILNIDGLEDNDTDQLVSRILPVIISLGSLDLSTPPIWGPTRT